MPLPAPNRYSLYAAQVAVVFHPDGQAEPLLHLLAERDIAQRNVHRGTEHNSALVVDSRWDAEADRRYPVMRKRPNRLDELGEQSFLRCRDGRSLDGVVHAAVRVDHPREDLGPAQVDSDDAVRAHNCRVT